MHVNDGVSVMSLAAEHKCGHASSMSNCVKPKNYRVNSKSGVNFQVELKRDRAIRNYIKRDLLVFFSHKSHFVERSMIYIALTEESSTIPDGLVNRKFTETNTFARHY